MLVIPCPLAYVKVYIQYYNILICTILNYDSNSQHKKSQYVCKTAGCIYTNLPFSVVCHSLVSVIPCQMQPENTEGIVPKRVTSIKLGITLHHRKNVHVGAYHTTLDVSHPLPQVYALYTNPLLVLL